MRPVFIYALLIVAFPALLRGAPISIKEITFLLRQETSESDIVKEVRQRKLLANPDDKAVAELRKFGATDWLIISLRAPGLALTPEELRVEADRVKKQETQTQKILAEVEEAALEKQKRAEIQTQPEVPVREMLEGRLVRLDSGVIRDVDPAEIQDGKIFAFYHSSMSVASCRTFTPTLIAAYKELKELYPEFEVIFVSNDKDDYNMKFFMKEFKMPWPAVRFDAISSDVKRWAGTGLPWLVVVNEKGQPLTKNGTDKQFMPPERILETIRAILHQMAPQR